jgi:hypothetical protein
MADDTSQFDEQDLHDEYSDEVVRLFLFGRLPAARQVKFEERLFADEQFETRVRLAEHELADDYAYERLSATERDLFEQKFLVSTARQQKLKVSHALREHFAVSLPVAAKATIGDRLQRLLSWNQVSWKSAAALVTLVLLAGTIALLLRRPQLRQEIITQSQRLIPRRRSIPPARPGSDREVTHHAIKPQSSGDENPPPPAPGATVVANIILVPETGYDSDRITQVNLLQSEVNVLHVRLAVERKRAGLYDLEISTTSGSTVFRESLISADTSSAAVAFEIPVRYLVAGDYQIKLMRITEGEAEGVGTYYLRVQ